MSDERIIGEAALHAYFDGELEDDARQNVEQWIEQHPEERVRLEAWQKQKSELKNLFNPILKERVPRRIKSTVRQVGRATGGRRRAEGLRAVAASILFLLGGAVGWGLAHLNTGEHKAWPSLAVHAISAHLVFAADRGRPVEVPGGKRKTLLKWVSKRLGKRIDIPDFTKAGFVLVGGRVLPVDNRPAAQFMYQDRKGRRITLFLGWNPWKKDTEISFWAKGKVKCFFWFDGPLGYALSGSLGKKQLGDMSKVVYEHFEKLDL